MIIPAVASSTKAHRIHVHCVIKEDIILKKPRHVSLMCESTDAFYDHSMLLFRSILELL